MTIRQSLPFANGTATIPTETDAGLLWHEIALAFFEADGVTPYGPLTGSADMTALGAFADLPEAGTNPLDLATERRWAPFLSSLREVSVTIAGIPADARCVATLVSSVTA